MAKKGNSTASGISEAEKRKAKVDKFIELCEPRVTKACKAIDYVGKLASANYIYTSEQTTAITTALQAAVDRVKAKFAGKKVDEGGFKLPK
jgi:hypothetical protein